MSASLNPIPFILHKRDGGRHAPEDIRALIEAYTRGTVADYQMSAWLMAAFLQGLDASETTALTDAMLYSGEVLDLSDVPGTKVDKHSTGGVGDKVSLLLAPIVAACGVPVPMISGRGLGHSGGTLDKLESIPGFQTDLPLDRYRRQLCAIGLVMIGQTQEIAPADRKLYALRDVTGTVECVPLIASSIMSKKLAEGIDALVLDVKCGRGAFMETEPEARHLAETLVAIGERFEKETVAYLTRMDAPLGRAVGNWPEVAESIRCLRGDAAGAEDLMEVTHTLSAEMVRLGGVATTLEEGRRRSEEVVRNGAALAKLRTLIESQGGDPRVVEAPGARTSPDALLVEAPSDARGYVAALDARAVGWLAVDLGAGRRRKEDTVDPLAGLDLLKKPGDPVAPGEPLARLYTQRSHERDAFVRALRAAYAYALEPPPVASLVIDRIG